MTPESLEALRAELLTYVSEVGEGKYLETTAIELRNKIDSLNELIDTAFKEDNNDFKILVNICYQYYRLLYG